MESCLKIYIIYKSDGIVDNIAHKSFQSALDAVMKSLEQDNHQAKIDGYYTDFEERPAKMEKEFNYKDEQGGILVAHDELQKISTLIKELRIN